LGGLLGYFGWVDDYCGVAGGGGRCGGIGGQWWHWKMVVVAGIGRRVATLLLPLLAGVCW